MIILVRTRVLAREAQRSAAISLTHSNERRAKQAAHVRACDVLPSTITTDIMFAVTITLTITITITTYYCCYHYYCVFMIMFIINVGTTLKTLLTLVPALVL